jgi:hypothetical protein
MGESGFWVEGVGRGIFIGAKVRTGVEQHPDSNPQRNLGLLIDLATNRIGFCFH